MWQRVQTLYLLISTALVSVLFFCNMAVSYGSGGEVAEYYTYTSSIPYVILLVVLTALNLLALTTFKIRIFQMRTASLAALIAIALQAWLVVDFIFTGSERVFRFTAVFPAISAIFNWLAARSILADQLMVENASRLRNAHHRKK